MKTNNDDGHTRIHVCSHVPREEQGFPTRFEHPALQGGIREFSAYVYSQGRHCIYLYSQSRLIMTMAIYESVSARTDPEKSQASQQHLALQGGIRESDIYTYTKRVGTVYTIQPA